MWRVMGRASGLGRRLARAIAGGLALGWIAAATPLGAQPSGPIRSSGSSTVGPIMALAIQGFTATGAGRGVSFKPVVENGTSAGFREFCAGTTAISQASRPISGKELSACKAAGVEFYELPIGFDAITVVVHPSNSWARDISLSELKKLWSRSAQQNVNRWNQVRASWPERPRWCPRRWKAR